MININLNNQFYLTSKTLKNAILNNSETAIRTDMTNDCDYYTFDTFVSSALALVNNYELKTILLTLDRIHIIAVCYLLLNSNFNLDNFVKVDYETRSDFLLSYLDS